MTDERDYTSRGVDEAFDEELPREPWALTPSQPCPLPLQPQLLRLSP